MGLRQRLRKRLRQLGELRRGVWTGDGRTWLELREGWETDPERIGAALAARLPELEGVHWARLNAHTGRLVVAHDPGLPRDTLVERLSALEAELGLGKRPFPLDPTPFPGESEPLSRAAIETAADVAGLAVGTVLRLSGARVAPGSIDVEAALAVARNVPGLRRILDERLGSAASDMALALSGAASSAMMQGASGLITDGIHRALRISELSERQRVWAEREPELAGAPDRHDGSPPARRRRRPLPDGPIESYSSQAVLASLGGFGAAVATSHHIEDATAAIFGGVPKAARHGRDAWAATFGKELAKRGTIVMRPAALRELDRIDTLVVQGELLHPLGGEMVDLVPVGAIDDAVRREARELFDPADPFRVVGSGPWLLGPLSIIDLELDLDTRPIRAGAGVGGRLLGLAHKGTLRAVLAVRPEVDPHAEALVDAARAAGLQLVSSGDPSRIGWARVTDCVPSEGLRDAIEALQERDHGVAFLGTDPEGIAAAHLSIGVVGDAGVPWGADLLVSGPISEACATVRGMRSARDASRQGVIVAEIEALASLALAVDGLGITAARRVLHVGNLAAMASMANGARMARQVPMTPHIQHRDHTPWHALEAEVVLERLRSERSGLSPSVALSRTRPVPREPTPWERWRDVLVEELSNPLAPALATGAALSALVGSPVDAMMVAGMLAFNGGVGALHRMRAEAAMAALDGEERRPVRVTRGGEELELDAAALVPGDIVALRAGEVVPADCRILQAEAVEADESALTGESLPVPKSAAPSFSPALGERSSMLWAGTTVAAGQAVGVVVAVGVDTATQGGLYPTAVHERARGGVEARLEQITAMTTPIAAGAGATILGVGMLRRRAPTDLVGTAVSLSVAAVPEGLPLLAMLAQLAAARRLAERGALVRNHRAVEALGRVNVLCADKTGTLTEGTLTLQGAWDGETLAPLDALTDGHRTVLADALRASPPAAEEGVLAHVTDQALWDGARGAGVGVTDGLSRWERVDELPFEPARGYHAVLGDQGGRLRLCIKGSPESLIPRCDRIKGPDGSNHRLDDDGRQELLDEAVRLAGQGYRVLVVAERGARTRRPLSDARMRRLVFRGLVLFADPLRPSARDAVARLHGAGVDVVMITGDHPATGAHRAEELGIATGRVLTGPELDRMSDDDLHESIGDVKVFARVTPAQKVRIVRALQQLGKVVAMTGDGANDAPAIRLADVGIAIGEDATPAARQAADLVVVDGRIETLVDAVLEGRALWSSVRSAVAMLVGGNLGEIGFTVLGGLLEGRPPLNARQLMLVNLLTDALPGLVLALQEPSPDQVGDLTAGPDEALGEALDRDILWRAVVTGGAAGAAWLAARSLGPPQRASTVGLYALVGAQLTQTIAAAPHSRDVWMAAGGALVALLAIVQTPGLSHFFGSRPLGPLGLAQAAAASAGAVAVGRYGPAVAREARRLARELGVDEVFAEDEAMRLLTESRVLRRLLRSVREDAADGENALADVSPAR